MYQNFRAVGSASGCTHLIVILAGLLLVM